MINNKTKNKKGYIKNNKTKGGLFGLNRSYRKNEIKELYDEFDKLNNMKYDINTGGDNMPIKGFRQFIIYLLTIIDPTFIFGESPPEECVIDVNMMQIMFYGIDINIAGKYSSKVINNTIFKSFNTKDRVDIEKNLILILKEINSNMNKIINKFYRQYFTNYYEVQSIFNFFELIVKLIKSFNKLVCFYKKYIKNEIFLKYTNLTLKQINLIDRQMRCNDENSIDKKTITEETISEYDNVFFNIVKNYDKLLYSIVDDSIEDDIDYDSNYEDEKSLLRNIGSDNYYGNFDGGHHKNKRKTKNKRKPRRKTK